MALILLDTIVAHLIDDMLAVGGCLLTADASHRPKGLWGHHSALQFDILFTYHVVLCYTC